MKKQRGLTLAEILVSLLVGSILTAGIVQIVVNNRATYLANESLSRLKENGRFARYVLKRDIRMAGFQGCNNTKALEPKNLVKNPTAAQSFLDTNVIFGYHGAASTWNPQIPNWISNHIPSGTQIVSDSDVITVRRLGNANNYLTASMINDTDNIIVSDRIPIKTQDILFITDCEETNIFQVSAGSTNTQITHHSADNISNALSKAYDTDAYIGRVNTATYYVRTSTRTNRTGQPINVLARQDINGNEEVLIEGIDNMKITYGLDTTGDRAPDTFVTADVVNAQNAWNQVVIVRISQLLNSIEEVGRPNQPYRFMGANLTANDRRLRRQWDMDIAIRNRNL